LAPYIKTRKIIIKIAASFLYLVNKNKGATISITPVN
jgi:hypothetical protein